MIVRTIREAIMDCYAPTQGYVYVVRNGEDVLYVGKANNPLGRLQNHLMPSSIHGNTPKPSATVEKLEGWGDRVFLPHNIQSLGKCIFYNAPGSLDWSFNIYELEDAIDVLERAGYGSERTDEMRKEVDWKEHSDAVETALIHELKPYLNSAKNPYKRKLPKKYKMIE